MTPDVGLGTEGPVQRGWELWIMSVVMVVLSALFVVARMLQRILKTGKLGLDDYTIIAALIASALLSLTECQAVKYGYGKHIKTVPHDKAIIARKWFYGAQIMYKVVIMLNKISVACLYWRIFSVSSKRFRTACYICQAFIISSSLAFILGTIFQCRPVAAFWDKTIPNYWCFAQEPWWLSYSIVQILTDVILLTLPISQTRKLSMTRAEKLGLSLVFCTGLFVTFTSIFRATTLAASSSDPDPLWGPIPATVWAVIEANSGIICACLPMLRQPFVRIFGGFLPSRSGTSRKQQSYQLESARSAGRSAGRSVDKDEESAISEDRKSEEGIVGRGGGGGSGYRTPVGGRGPDGGERGIYVQSEFTVQTSREEDKKSDRNAPSAYMHI